MEIQYTVVGIPKPQARPKFFRNKAGFIGTYSPKTDWFGLVYGETLKQKEKIQEKLKGALQLNLLFFMPIPKSISKKKREQLKYVIKKPDVDNLAKAVMDAMNNAGIWEDDSQISRLDVLKVYGEEPKCIITVIELED